MHDDKSRIADGTQPVVEPSGAFADPLVGLAGSAGVQESDDGEHVVHVPGQPQPAAPDPETVRGLLGGVFAPNSPVESATAEATVRDEGAVDTDDGAPVRPVERAADERERGDYSGQRRSLWPRRQRLTRQAWRPRRRPTPRRPRARADRSGRRKPTRGSAGVAVAIALLLLFCFVAVELVISLMNTFSGLGG